MEKSHVIIQNSLHGSINANALDLVCEQFQKVTIFDGRDVRLFSWSEEVVFSREIHDFRLYEVAMLSGTFRSANEISRTIGRSASEMYCRLGTDLSCKRRQSSDVFSAFLGTIEYSGDDLLQRLFSCDECEEDTTDETKILRRVVMDGTSTRVLGILSEFQRPSILVEPVKDAAKSQFIITVPRLLLRTLAKGNICILPQSSPYSA